ncbi:MAG: ABC transporter permease [Mesorhizobium sp.]|nr:MAG: ABC transporter permease [Mesorhizobium sp.]
MDAEIKASAPGLAGRNWLRLGSMREAGLIAIMLALCIAMTFASPHFLTWGNFRAMLMSFSIEGIVVVGMTILLIVGGIVLSVGSVVCFSMVVSGALFLMGLDPWTASLIGIGASALIGAVMGFFVTVIGLNHFITSLAAMVIVRGLCLVITKGTPLSLFTLPPGFKAIGQGSFGNVPYVIVIFVVVVAIFDFLLRRATAFRKVTVLCSTLAGFAGIIYMSRFGAATPTFGAGMELNIIAAAVIGGASLNGGSGTIFGAILGMALLSVVTSSLILLDVSVYWQDMIKGCILLAAVSIDHFLHRRKS